jgi:hypothetical protein
MGHGPSSNSLPSDYSPLYHSSAVLPHGRVIIEGGEYQFFVPIWTNLGAIYDTLANFPRFAPSKMTLEVELVQ